MKSQDLQEYTCLYKLVEDKDQTSYRTIHAFAKDVFSAIDKSKSLVYSKSKTATISEIICLPTRKNNRGRHGAKKGK